MTSPNFPSFCSIIELWPTRDGMASDIGATPAQVSKWWQRDSIPSEWWAAVLRTERAADAKLTSDVMTDLAARPAAPGGGEPEFVEART